jgi:carbonic anhydrase
MQNYLKIFERNQDWSAAMRAADPEYFAKREATQTPQFLFIGCCDSRVPAELLMGARPGEVFTHRNIANQAHPTDLSMLSALEYAVEVLDVKHVIVCGHYNCGGVKAAMEPAGHGIVDHWLQRIRDLTHWHQEDLDAVGTESAKFMRLVELNVIEQVFNLSRTPVVQRSWAKGRRPILHGLVYDLHDGLLKELVSALDGEDKADLLRDVVGRPVVTIPAGLHGAPT